MSRVVQLTSESITSLQSVVEAVSQLSESSLGLQLRATASLCDHLGQHQEYLGSQSLQPVINVLDHIGKYSQRVKQSIDAIPDVHAVDWTILQVDGRTVSGIAAFIQMQTYTVVIGVVDDARFVDTVLATTEKLTNGKQT